MTAKRILTTLLLIVALSSFAIDAAAAAPAANADGFGYSGPMPANNPLNSPIYLTGFEDPEYLNNNLGIVFDGTYIWVIPYTGKTIVKFDPATGDTVAKYPYSSGTNMGNANSTAKPFYGGIFDGKHIWLVPYESNAIVSVDVSDGSMVGYPIADLVGEETNVKSNTSKFYGGTFDGRNVWFAPHEANSVVKIDTVTHVITGYSLANVINKGNVWTKQYHFSGAQFDGQNIWLIPDRADRLVKMDPATGIMTGYTLAGTTMGNIGAVAGTNGVARVSVYDGTYLWLIPQDGDSLIRVNTADASMKGFPLAAAADPGNTLSQTFKFAGASYDGQNIWMIPRDANRIWKFNPTDNTFSTFALNGINLGNSATVSARFYGAVFDGTNIWCSPLNANRLVKISPTGGLAGNVTEKDTAAVLPATKVEITHKDGTVYQVASDISGNYSFPILPVGDYTVKGIKDGYFDSEQYNVTIVPNTTAIQNLQLELKKSISGVAWLDTDMDGVMDGDESERMPGVRVFLRKTGDAAFAEIQTDTDGNGAYIFSDLHTGNYELVFDKSNILNAGDYYWSNVIADNKLNASATAVLYLVGASRNDIHAGLIPKLMANIIIKHVDKNDHSNVLDTTYDTAQVTSLYTPVAGQYEGWTVDAASIRAITVIAGQNEIIIEYNKVTVPEYNQIPYTGDDSSGLAIPISMAINFTIIFATFFLNKRYKTNI